MAERTVAVKLVANVAAYTAAMRSAASASGQFSTETQASMRKLGVGMQRVGGTLSRSVTLPLVAAGIGAVKLGLDFDTAFSRMVGLAGVAAGEVDGLKKSVLDLAGETGQAPVDLANALYEAASAGLDSAQAMDAVEVAAKGAAAGMGSAEDIVGLVASATASYGDANITAAEAVDILTQTIREGRADPQELAGTLGRILPIAAQLGVSFSEVGGIVAYTTNAFGDTDRAVTGVNDALAKLSAPTDSARQVLLDMGTSVEELHAAIRDDGLLGGLQLLRDHGFAGNAAAIRELMPDMQGAATLTLLLNDNAGTLTETLAATADSAGAAGEAFATAAETDMFKMRQAWADLQVALIQAGDIIIPIVTGVVGAISDLAEKFTNLPGPAQAAVLGVLAFAAAVGPLTTLGGHLVTNLGTIITVLGRLKVAMATHPIIAFATVIGGLAALAVFDLAEEAKKAEEAVTGLRDSMTEGTSAADALTDHLNGIVRENAGILTLFDNLKLTTREVAAAALEGGAAWDTMRDKLIGSILTVGASGDEIRAFTDTLDALPGLAVAATEQVDQLARVTGDSGKAARTSGDAAGALAVSFADLDVAASDLITTTGGLAGVIDENTFAAERSAKQYQRQKETADAARQAHEQLREELLRGVGQVFAYEAANLRLVTGVRDFDAAVAAGETSAEDLRLQEIALAEQAYATAVAFAEEQTASGNAAGAADLQKFALMQLQDQFPGLRDELQAHIDKLNAIPPEKSTTVRTNYVATGNRVMTRAANGSLAPIAVAEGIIVDRPTHLFAGEAGREVVLPLTNEGRMRRLVNDPRVFGPLMSAIAGGRSSTPSSSPSPTQASAASSGGLHIHGDIVAADWRDAMREMELIEWRRSAQNARH